MSVRLINAKEWLLTILIETEPIRKSYVQICARSTLCPFVPRIVSASPYAVRVCGDLQILGVPRLPKPPSGVSKKKPLEASVSNGLRALPR